jgi:hypothetical protein
MLTTHHIKLYVGYNECIVDVGPWFYDDLFAIRREDRLLMRANKDVLNPGPCTHNCYFAHCGMKRTIVHGGRNLYVTIMNGYKGLIYHRKRGQECKCGCEVIPSKDSNIYYHPLPSGSKKEAWDIEKENAALYDQIYVYYNVKVGDAAPYRSYVYPMTNTIAQLYHGGMPSGCKIKVDGKVIKPFSRLNVLNLKPGTEINFYMPDRKPTQLDSNSCTTTSRTVDSDGDDENNCVKPSVLAKSKVKPPTVILQQPIPNSVAIPVPTVEEFDHADDEASEKESLTDIQHSLNKAGLLTTSLADGEPTAMSVGSSEDETSDYNSGDEGDASGFDEVLYDQSKPEKGVTKDGSDTSKHVSGKSGECDESPSGSDRGDGASGLDEAEPTPPKELLDGHIYGNFQILWFIVSSHSLRIKCVLGCLLFLLFLAPMAMLALMAVGAAILLVFVSTIKQKRYEVETPSDLRLIINQSVQRVERPFVVMVWRCGWGKLCKVIPYVPHIVDCLISDSAFDAAETLHSNLLVRVRRLASFPMPDFWHTGLVMGSVDLAEKIIRNRGFYVADEYARSTLIRVGVSPLAIERQRSFTRSQRHDREYIQGVWFAGVIAVLILVLCVMGLRLALLPFRQTAMTQQPLEKVSPGESIGLSPSLTQVSSGESQITHESSLPPTSRRLLYLPLRNGSQKRAIQNGAKTSSVGLKILSEVESRLSDSPVMSTVLSSLKTIRNISLPDLSTHGRTISRFLADRSSKLLKTNFTIFQDWSSALPNRNGRKEYADWFKVQMTGIMLQIIPRLKALLPHILWRLWNFNYTGFVGVGILDWLILSVVLCQVLIDVVHVMRSLGRSQRRGSLAICVLHLVTHLLTTWSYVIGFTSMILRNCDPLTSHFLLRVTMVCLSPMFILTQLGLPNLALLPRLLVLILWKILTSVTLLVPVMVVFFAILWKYFPSSAGLALHPRGDGLLEIDYSKLSVFLGYMNALLARF